MEAECLKAINGLGEVVSFSDTENRFSMNIYTGSAGAQGVLNIPSGVNRDIEISITSLFVVVKKFFIDIFDFTVTICTSLSDDLKEINMKFFIDYRFLNDKEKEKKMNSMMMFFSNIVYIFLVQMFSEENFNSDDFIAKTKIDMKSIKHMRNKLKKRNIRH